MSLLYKEKGKMKYYVEIERKEDNLNMLFYCNGGKFGTEENLDEIEISPKELLEILQKHYKID